MFENQIPSDSEKTRSRGQKVRAGGKGGQNASMLGSYRKKETKNSMMEPSQEVEKNSGLSVAMETEVGQRKDLQLAIGNISGKPSALGLTQGA